MSAWPVVCVVFLFAGRADARQSPAEMLRAIEFMSRAQTLLEEVQRSRELPRETVRTKLEEVSSMADAILANPKLAKPDYRIATLVKATALDLMAERVELDPDRRLALLVESSRYSAPIAQHVNGKPPAARKLTPRQAEELEWEYVSRWTQRLLDQNAFVEARVMAREYAAQRPSYYRAHAQLGEVQIRSADAAADAKTRQEHLIQALGPLQRVISLTPNEIEREKAFDALIDLLGPARLNQPAWIEDASRTMVQRYPPDAGPRATLAMAQFRAGKFDDADATVRAVSARAAKTPVLRTEVANRLVTALRSDKTLTPVMLGRAADAVDRLLTEAEKLDANSAAVLEARAGWLRMRATRLETDPARVKALHAQAQQLLDRALALHKKKG